MINTDRHAVGRFPEMDKRVIATLPISKCVQFSPAYPLNGYVINMDSAVARWSKIQSQIAEGQPGNKVLYKRFPAVDGAKMPSHLKVFSNGQWGCFQSHAQIIKYFSESDRPILVMEDDEIITERASLAPALIELANTTDPDWDVIYLDATLVQAAEIREFAALASAFKKADLIALASIKPADRIFGCHSYIVNPRSIARLAKMLETLLPQQKAVDNCFVALCEAGLLKCYITLPFLMYGSDESMTSQISTPSDERYKAWLSIRRALAATGTPDSVKSEVEDGLTVHHQLFGEGVFGHFVDIKNNLDKLENC